MEHVPVDCDNLLAGLRSAGADAGASRGDARTASAALALTPPAPACEPNVSCVTDNDVLFIQADRVKAFPHLFIPAGLLAVFLIPDAGRLFVRKLKH